MQLGIMRVPDAECCMCGAVHAAAWLSMFCQMGVGLRLPTAWSKQLLLRLRCQAGAEAEGRGVVLHEFTTPISRYCRTALAVAAGCY